MGEPPTVTDLCLIGPVSEVLDSSRELCYNERTMRARPGQRTHGHAAWLCRQAPGRWFLPRRCGPWRNRTRNCRSLHSDLWASCERGSSRTTRRLTVSGCAFSSKIPERLLSRSKRCLTRVCASAGARARDGRVTARHICSASRREGQWAQRQHEINSTFKDSSEKGE